MNHKFYVGALRRITASTARTPCHGSSMQRFASLFGLLALAACSSAGSTFASGGSTSTSDGGSPPTSGGTGVGGDPLAAGGDAQSNAGSTGVPGGGDVGAGGTNNETAGSSGAPPAGGGAPPAGGAPPVGGAGGAGAAGATSQACPLPGGICHEFFANDNSKNEVHYVNQFEPTKSWVKGVGDTGDNSPRGAQLVDNTTAKGGKAVLVSINKGFAEFDMADGSLLRKVSSVTAGGVTSALRIPSDGTTKLPPGTTVLARDAGNNTAPQLIFINPTGGSASATVALPFAATGQELRKLERNPTTGNFSLTRYEGTSAAYIYEVTEAGTMVSKIKLPAGAKGYNALWVSSGFMATTGSLASLVTVGPTGAVSATLGGKGAFKDAGGTEIFMDFFSGFFRLSNGNVVAANWLGHVNPANYPTTPELLEITPQNKLAWSWGNQSDARYITYAYFVR
jgi:hypothetical protein